MNNVLSLPLRTVINGEEWKLYCVDYRNEAEDKTMSAWLFARSFEDAYAQLMDLKETGVVNNCLVGVTR
ncbi:hypothetical protein D3C81_441820 [compost metagenome]